MPSGKTSLYLDIYCNGRREYEYLKLYLIPEHDKEAAKKNRQTIKLAEMIYAKRLLDIENKRFAYISCGDGCNVSCSGSCGGGCSNGCGGGCSSMAADKPSLNNTDSPADNTDFYSYYSTLFDGNKTKTNWPVVLTHMQNYCHNPIKLTDLDNNWIKGFFAYLNRLKISDSSKATYLSIIMSAVNHAVKDGLLPSNPIISQRRHYKVHEANRAYLTIDELRSIASTPMRHNGVKRAFLFSCLTGLRKSDIINLTWGDVVQQGNMTRIIFKQQKTKRTEYLDINPQAVEYMGERGSSNTKVFKDFHYHGYINCLLRDWAKNAGIGKHITFHSARHTFAVMMLDIGVDIYTTSKLLGHTNVKTTQIYAKVLDKNKQAAVLKIPDISRHE